jgi:hypothetical protein
VDNLEEKVVCEYCKQISANNYLYPSETTDSDIQLCIACHRYERKNGKLIRRNKRIKRVRVDKKKKITVCEFCKYESNNYLTLSKPSGLKLCSACRWYEGKHGKLVPREKRGGLKKPNPKKKKPCDYCKQYTNVYSSETSALELCLACQQYEVKHGKLDPRNKKCDICHKDSDDTLSDGDTCMCID